MDPGPDVPRALLDALFCISEMSQPSARASLLEEAERQGVVPGPEETQMETALRLWMADPEALLARHAELAMLRVRSFEYFSAVEEEAELSFSPDQSLQAMEKALDIWFESKGRGRGTRIHAYPRGSEIWFLLRRGDLYKRVVALEGGDRRSLGYRPEKYDVVVYSQLTNELGINAESKAIRDQYRKQFSYYLFGRDNHFGGTSKYTLEPLRSLGESALNVLDVHGIQWVRLAELRYLVPDPIPTLTTRKAEDVFVSLRAKSRLVQSTWQLKRATFKVRFDDNPKPRTVTIKPANVALYTRDSDSLVVEEWLTCRGFIEQGTIHDCAQRQFILPSL